MTPAPRALQHRGEHFAPTGTVKPALRCPRKTALGQVGPVADLEVLGNVSEQSEAWNVAHNARVEKAGDGAEFKQVREQNTVLAALDAFVENTTGRGSV